MSLVLLASHALNTTVLEEQHKHREQDVRHFVFILHSHVKLPANIFSDLVSGNIYSARRD